MFDFISPPGLAAGRAEIDVFNQASSPSESQSIANAEISVCLIKKRRVFRSVGDVTKGGGF